MRIDSISQSPDRTGRFLVKFSDGSTMKLYRQTVEDFRLYPGMELESLEALRESAGSYSAKMRAVRIVSASAVSKRDLENRLVRKGEDPGQAYQKHNSQQSAAHQAVGKYRLIAMSLYIIFHISSQCETQQLRYP
jgi:hypothetical protein